MSRYFSLLTLFDGRSSLRDSTLQFSFQKRTFPAWLTVFRTDRLFFFHDVWEAALCNLDASQTNLKIVSATWTAAGPSHRFFSIFHSATEKYREGKNGFNYSTIKETNNAVPTWEDFLWQKRTKKHEHLKELVFLQSEERALKTFYKISLCFLSALAALYLHR